MTENTKYYKIRRKSDGLFSTGGVSPSFRKKGKTWSSRAALDGHIALLFEYSHYHPDYKPPHVVYRDCEVITLEILATDAKPVEDFLTAKTA